MQDMLEEPLEGGDQAHLVLELATGEATMAHVVTAKGRWSSVDEEDWRVWECQSMD